MANSPSEPARRLVELPPAECLALLADTPLGRVVVAGRPGQAPVVRPVSYLFHAPSKSVVFRTSDGSTFHMLVRSTNACFEIDGVEPENQTGWSVIILGRTEEITQSGEIRRLDAAGLRTWAPGERSHWIRIRAQHVSGRRIVSSGQG